MIRQKLFMLLFFAFVTNASAQNIGLNCLEIKFPNIIVSDVNLPIKLKIVSDTSFGQFEGIEKTIYINDKPNKVTFHHNEAVIKYNFPEEEIVQIKVDDFSWEKAVTPIPLWMSILPPLVAILLALLLKEVFSALFMGILTGTSIMFYYQGTGFFVAIGKGFLAVIDTYVMESLLDRGHLSIIIFSLIIGGMVQLISSNGGMKGVVNRLSVFARSSRSGQLVTWFLGMVIFFDDYANTLVVGNTMRPVADRLRISRAKLAYIVDSTAAPIAAIAFVTTWIGAELSYIQDGLNVIGLNQSAYNVFFNSLAYSYYPILTLIFVLMLILMKRDYGPMLKSENTVRSQNVDANETNSTKIVTSEDKFDASGKPARAFNAVIPVAVIIFGTITGLLYTGWDVSIWESEEISFMTKISEIIGRSNSYASLLWSSISALVVAFVLTFSQKLLSLQQIVESILEGFRIMLTAILILTLAWSVALVTEHMHTADFIADTLLSMSFSPYLIPAFTFILAALVAFSTGTSWGTMAILYPLLLPTSWLLTQSAGINHDHGLTIFYSVVSAVLSGAILGDHVSPISDTTILSSISSGCNHIEHVRTQMPYALTVGFVAVVFGTIPASYGIFSSWLLMLFAIAVLYLFIRFVGKKQSSLPYNIIP
ncbi:MAG: sodium:proton antiporter [Bacteroidetes bacterium HGW-Bacteroidetes-1]|jgi:Na+/H+ antiporter NhaC|nr:MAG: sodium:proton antiporter [Bacteroidetes bacterium HGW-Bacteroidetes-1]